jgi:hypothetical protein
MENTDKTIDQLTVGDRVRGINGYSVVQQDTNAPYNLFYAFVAQNVPADWPDETITNVSDDDEDHCGH